jgi:hypothetical protein
MAEIKTLQDANRALQLYMNKILLRIVESKHLETILSIDEPNKTTSTSTIIKPTTDTVLNPRKTTSCDSFSTEDTPSTTSSDDGWDDSDASGDTGAGSGGDSWTQVFRRMSSGFAGWSRTSDTKYTTYESPSIDIDNSVRSLYLINK